MKRSKMVTVEVGEASARLTKEGWLEVWMNIEATGYDDKITFPDLDDLFAAIRAVRIIRDSEGRG